jgi:hypothetical protein
MRVALLSTSLIASGCSPREVPEDHLSVPISAESIAQASGRRVVFAHQSVGNDILQGVAKLRDSTGTPVTIVETRQPAATGAGIFHFKVGVNGAPKGKIEDFVRTLSADGISGIDIALLKLCYIDFDDNTNASDLAEEYLGALQTLRAAHPTTRFVAVTAPVTTIQSGPKAWLKRLLGTTPAGYAANARRHEFNEVLRRQSMAAELFDLAKAESEGNGKPATFEFAGRRIQALDPRFTYDGGHLNEAGQLRVAASFLEFLAQTAPQGSSDPPSGT